MRFLLVNLPVREDLPPNTPNIGLAYLSASLKEKGHEVALLDLNVLRPDAEKLEQLIDDICAIGGFDGALISAMISQYAKACIVIDHFKRNGVKTVIGGSLASACPELMARHADTVIVGEGETWNPETQFSGIIKTKVVADINSIPRPDYSIFDMGKYLGNPVGGAVNKNKWDTGQSKRKERSMLILSSRGCPYDCIFCHKDYLGLKPRWRSVHSIIQEITQYCFDYDITNFSFADDNFTAQRRRLLKFCELFDPRGLTWGCASRIDTLDEETIIAMKAANCKHVGFGLESGSPRILETANKKLDLDKAAENVVYLKKHKMNFDYTLICGLPGETMDSVMDTIRFCRQKIGKPPENIFFATGYPKTKLWESLGFIMDNLPHELQITPHCYLAESNQYGTLERYLNSLGENDERMIINFSSMPDGELMAAMEYMRNELGVKNRKARRPKRILL